MMRGTFHISSIFIKYLSRNVSLLPTGVSTLGPAIERMIRTEFAIAVFAFDLQGSISRRHIDLADKTTYQLVWLLKASSTIYQQYSTIYVPH
jgi:hypothetical protein